MQRALWQTVRSLPSGAQKAGASQLAQWLFRRLAGSADPEADRVLLYVMTRTLDAAGTHAWWLPGAIFRTAGIPPAVRRHHLIVETAALLYDRWIEPVTPETRERLDSLARWLAAHGAPEYTLIKGVSYLAFKSESKRNIPYLVGMLRSWQQSGMFRMITSDHHSLWEAIREETGIAPGPAVRERALLLGGQYGMVPVAVALVRETRQSPGALLVEELERKLGEHPTCRQPA